jgi:5,10-methenyltetrahydromethanopterin hydrogenase
VISLPQNIVNSTVLSSEEKQQLAGVTEIPVVDPAFEDEKLKNIFQYYSLMPEEMDLEIHKYASALLHQKKVKEAWQVLLSTEVT